MLEPTDRVIAKSLVRAMGLLANSLSNNVNDKASAMTFAIVEATMPNADLFSATAQLVAEVKEELYAEDQGTAEPVAGPWLEDAGSGA